MRKAKIIVILLLGLIAGLGQAQDAGASPQQQELNKLVLQYQAQPCAFSATVVTCEFDRPDHYGAYLAAAKASKQDLMVQTDLNRTDKQVGQTGAAGNSSSTVSTGSVPWLIGVALEHGAVTQSVENNLITFRGNIANVIKATKWKDYIQSYRGGQDNMFVRNISKASFSISYNTAQGASADNLQTGNLAGYSFHIDLYNHRDPRDARYDKDWDRLLANLGDVANANGKFFTAVSKNHRSELRLWQARADAVFKTLQPDATSAQILTAFQAVADDFVATFGGFDDALKAARNVAVAADDYGKQKGQVVYKIMHSPIVSVEYVGTKQSSTQLPESSASTTTVATSTTTVAGSLPDLSTINVILETYLLKDSQFTINASTTLFNSTPPGSKIGNVRDYRFAGQTDIPLPEIPPLGKPTLSLSGLFLSLLEEPLGQQVLVNGVAESRRGNIGLFQAKVSFPVKNAGIAIPISITASNRTELIKENDVRGSIGVTFNLDHIFAKQ
jgi:hypothetical protein